MSVTITRAPAGIAGVLTISPFMVLGYSYRRPSLNIVHDIIGTATPEVTVGPAGTREGTLKFLCLDSASASALETFHQPAGTYSLVDTGQSMGNINYVLAEGGSVSVEQNENRKGWTVSIDIKGI